MDSLSLFVRGIELTSAHQCVLNLMVILLVFCFVHYPEIQCG